MKLFLRFFLILTATASTISCAGDYNSATGKPPTGIPATTGPIAERLEKMVGVAPDSLAPSAAAGILEAKWGSNFAYVTADGRYAVFGDMVNIDTLEEVTENTRRTSRVALLNELGAENMIEFAPESPKYTVTVFTDVDCGYCRMMHKQVPEYNAEGISIRYVFYPRTGPNTDSFRKAEAIWCAEDRKAALTAAKASGDIQGPSDCINPIKREWDLGQKLSLRGTPLIVLPNGDTVAGYIPPQELLARLANLGVARQVGKR